MDQQTSENSYETEARPKKKREDIIQRIWRLKTYFIVPVVLCLLMGIFLVSASIASRDTETYTYKIGLKFSGVQAGKYPNGEDFHLRDIIAPNIIDKVYDDHIAGQFKVSGQQFRSAITISSFSPSSQLILKRFENLMANRRITPAEATKLQLDLANALKTSSRNAATLSFQNNTLKLPAGLVATTLESIVQEWNEFSVEKRGVLSLNISGLEPAFLNPDSFQNTGEINRLHTIIEMYQKVKNRVEQLGKFEVATALRDAESGATFSSLSSKLSELEGKIIDLPRSWLIDANGNRPTLPGLLSSKSFGSEAIKGLDAQIAYDLLLERITDIRTNIEKIVQADGASVTDPSTNISITDLQNILNEMETFQIRPLRDAVLQSGQSENPESVRAYYQQRIRDFELSKKEYNALAQVISQVNSQNEDKNGGTTISSDGPTAQNSLRTTTVIPQFDDGFLDRLIDMSSKGDETKFRQELARRSINLLESVARIDSKIASLKSDLSIFEAGLAAANQSTKRPVTSSAKETLNDLLLQLENHLNVTVRIGQRMAAADQIKTVMMSKLNLSSFDPRLEQRTFLRSDDLSNMTVNDIIDPLKEIVAISNRMSDELDKELYGTKSLSNSFFEPELIQQSVITRENIFTMVGALALGLLIGAALLAIRYFRLK